MKTFPLQIGTPDGLIFEGEVVRVVCRTITGDRAILAGHADFCTGLGMGEAHLVLEDESRKMAACIGGMLTMIKGKCRILATTWEWSEDIDVDRAKAAKKRAEAVLEKSDLSEKEYQVARAKLGRALVRISVKNQ